MTRTDMSLSEIRDWHSRGKPLYLHTGESGNEYDLPQRRRVYAVRKKAGQFQVKIQYRGEFIWMDAETKQVVLAY